MASCDRDTPLAIRAERLAKRFGRRRALDDVDLAIDGPQVFGIVGPDGAGKTTFLRIIAGLLDRDGGAMSVLGCDPGRDAAALKRRLGYVPQAFSMYPTLTVEENLTFVGRCHAMPRAALAERRHALLALAELVPFADARAETLSGGMKQKLALCGALLTRPALLVLDEPTNGVDLVARAELWATIRAQARDALVIVSTSYLDEAERCDGIVYLVDGRVVAAGPPHALRRRADVHVFELVPRAPRAGLAASLVRLGIERVEPTARGLRLETCCSRAAVTAMLAGLGLRAESFELEAVETDLETALLRLAAEAARHVEGWQ